MIRRNTEQKNLVKQAVFDIHDHVSAEEIYEHIRKSYPQIGKGTVYRNLNILSEEGEIRRVEIPNGPDYFDFTLKNHYHLRCVDCGKVFDVDMDEVSGLIDQVHDTKGMKILDYDILFKGVCNKCQNEIRA